MRFRLHYRGKLKSNGSPKDKQKIRRAIHIQLADLWTQSPLAHQAEQFLSIENPYMSVLRRVGDWTFSAVVSKTHFLVAELDIVLMRPEEPGALVTQGGDIDNRVKTLLDALTIPKSNQIPSEDTPTEDENPMHCLMEDDNLVTGLSIKVDRLLGSVDPTEVLVLIEVAISATKGTFKNLELSL